MSMEAALVGGSGGSRHGNVLPWVKKIVEEQLLSAKDEGELVINILLVSFTDRQSNEGGDLYLASHTKHMNQIGYLSLEANNR